MRKIFLFVCTLLLLSTLGLAWFVWENLPVRSGNVFLKFQCKDGKPSFSVSPGHQDAGSAEPIFCYKGQDRFFISVYRGAQTADYDVPESLWNVIKLDDYFSADCMCIAQGDKPPMPIISGWRLDRLADFLALFSFGTVCILGIFVLLIPMDEQLRRTLRTLGIVFAVGLLLFITVRSYVSSNFLTTPSYPISTESNG